MSDYMMPLTLRGHKVGVPHSDVALSEEEALKKIRSSCLDSSWKVEYVVDAMGRVALTPQATLAVRVEVLKVVKDLRDDA